MQLPIVLLLPIICQSLASPEIFLRDEPGFQSHLREHREFLDGIKNWFKRLKDNIYERLYGITTDIPPQSYEPVPLDLDKFDLQNRLRDRPDLILDLSKVSFDPDRDWGFRMGHWYIIRKTDPSVFDEDRVDNWDDQSRKSSPKFDYWTTQRSYGTDNPNRDGASASTELESTVTETGELLTIAITSVFDTDEEGSPEINQRTDITTGTQYSTTEMIDGSMEGDEGEVSQTVQTWSESMVTDASTTPFMTPLMTQNDIYSHEQTTTQIKTQDSESEPEKREEDNETGSDTVWDPPSAEVIMD
ncbi:hypothetical protein KM043_002282 [Ampulex compressa]|nr:hypothetical protein KM043_002282 [Ampulex compressa]